MLPQVQKGPHSGGRGAAGKGAIMLRTNEKALVEMSVQCQVCHPRGTGRHGVDHDGNPFLLPGTGAITYNVKVGDPAFGWEADHVEPGASTMLDQKDPYGARNAGFHFLSCIGNTARVVSGAAKGAVGVVTGHHGGSEHVLIDFSDADLDTLTHDDKIMIRAVGQGLKLLDYPAITVVNLSPALARTLGLRENGDGAITCPVARIVPGMLMGSGVGSTTIGRGDYDIMATDPAMIREHGLDEIRLGDIVAITDHDNRYGRSFRKGAITIGIVIHGYCHNGGHGPGVTTLLSAAEPIMVPVLKRTANIADYLKIGRKRPARTRAKKKRRGGRTRRR
jgi:hypothetical protein